MDPVNNESKTEDAKSENNIKTKHYYRGEEDVHKRIKTVSFSRQKF